MRRMNLVSRLCWLPSCSASSSRCANLEGCWTKPYLAIAIYVFARVTEKARCQADPAVQAVKTSTTLAPPSAVAATATSTAFATATATPTATAAAAAAAAAASTLLRLLLLLLLLLILLLLLLLLLTTTPTSFATTSTTTFLLLLLLLLLGRGLVMSRCYRVPVCSR